MVVEAVVAGGEEGASEGDVVVIYLSTMTDNAKVIPQVVAELINVDGGRYRASVPTEYLTFEGTICMKEIMQRGMLLPPVEHQHQIRGVSLLLVTEPEHC